MKRMLVMLLGVAALTGCGTASYDIKSVEKADYVKAEYTGIQVLQGDLTPEVSLSLNQADYKLTKYGLEKTGLKLDKLFVEVGDKVEKGQVLVSFSSDELRQARESAEKQIAENELSIAHLQRLMEIDSKADYKEDIARLTENIELDKMYLEEYEQQLRSFDLVAGSDGTVIYIDDKLKAGYYEPSEKLIGIGGGNGYYSATIKEEHDLKVGDIYTATFADIDYQLKLIEIREGKATDLIFEPISDMSALQVKDKPVMNIVGNTLKDVVYVKKSAVKEGERGHFVYRIDENKTIDAVDVVIGREIDDFIVIKEGIKAGEEVLQ